MRGAGFLEAFLKLAALGVIVRLLLMGVARVSTKASVSVDTLDNPQLQLLSCSACDTAALESLPEESI